MLPFPQTRSGCTFSPYSLIWDPDPLHLDPSFHFGPLLKQATIDASDTMHDSEPLLDAENAQRAEQEFAHHLSLSEMQQPNSTPQDPDQRTKKARLNHDQSLAVPGPSTVLKSHKNDGAHRRRQAKRAAEKEALGHPRRPKTMHKVLAESSPVKTQLVTKDLPVSKGGYEGKREIIQGFKVLMSPSKGLGCGLKIIQVDISS